MASAIDSDFLDDRIAAVKLRIIAIENAMLEVAGGAISYSLDTGQSRQSVTKSTPRQLQDSLDAALNLLATLDARRNGGGRVLRPAY